MKLRFLGLVFFALGVTAAPIAFAADMPIKAPIYKAPRSVAPTDIWSGFYFGGHLGGGWVRNQFSDPLGGFTTPGAFASGRGSGFLGGPQIGANWQTGNYVFGIQGDVAFTNLKTSVVAPLSATSTMDTRTNTIATVTGRVGYAWDMLLFYVKGGGAWAHNKYAVADPVLGINATGNATQSGYVVGGGWEWAFAPNWSVFLEYDYLGFGTKNGLTLTDPALGPGSFDVKQDIQMLKTGLNFKLMPLWR
jgi:outer membrane immunogenic protein